MQRLLTVCVGNICRSPVAAALLQAKLPDLEVESAGIAAVVGHDVDKTARSVAEANGLVLPTHSARQFSKKIGDESDLILVLEGGHKREIEQHAPQLSGRIMLLSHWVGAKDIPDPYRRSVEFHQIVFKQVSEAVGAWAERLGGKGRQD